MRRIYNSYKTVLEMMIDRKYTSSEDEKIPSFEEWMAEYEGLSEDEVREKLNFIYMKSDTDHILIAWSLTPALGSQNIQGIKVMMDERAVKRCIMVIQGKITPFAANAIKNLRIQSYFIETFTEEELQFNITRHDLVPRHIICSAAKKEEVLAKYAVSKTQLPQIKSTDPQVRYLGAVKNQLIKVVRKSDTMPTIVVNGQPQLLYDISYRIVV